MGTIAVALVEALLTGPGADGLAVTLSPRSEGRAAALAARHPAVTVAGDNQAVLDASDVVILSVLPGQVAGVCAELRFRDDHQVIGLAAGWPPSVLADHVAPASSVCQVIPLPMVTLHTGPVVLYPGVPAVMGLLEGCGDLVVLEHESDVIVLNCLSAVMSSHFELATRMVDWATSVGLPAATAVDYVTALFQGLGDEGVASRPGGLAGLAVAHETPGGLNEQVRRALTDAGAFDVLTGQLEDMRRTRLFAAREQ